MNSIEIDWHGKSPVLSYEKITRMIIWCFWVFDRQRGRAGNPVWWKEDFLCFVDKSLKDQLHSDDDEETLNAGEQLKKCSDDIDDQFDWSSIGIEIGAVGHCGDIVKTALRRDNWRLIVITQC